MCVTLCHPTSTAEVLQLRFSDASGGTADSTIDIVSKKLEHPPLCRYILLLSPPETKTLSKVWSETLDVFSIQLVGEIGRLRR